jgi:excisionase family DNA binding protein
MAARKRPALKPARRAGPGPRPLLYTAQDLARFCEVDLKTIHHWADGGKIAHHRTTGRHLRFRRNHVLAFLRRHGYPVHAELAHARPNVFLALGAEPSLDDIAKRLAARFFVRRFESALTAIAHLIADEPDVLVLAAGDATWTGPHAIRALKGSTGTAWTTLVVVTAPGDDRASTEAKEAGADLVIGRTDLPRLSSELARALDVD